MDQTRLKTATATNGHGHGPDQLAADLLAAEDGRGSLSHLAQIDAKTAMIAGHERIHVLPLTVAVYVPSTEDGRTISQSEFAKRTDQTARRLSDLFGGCTVIPAGGYWIDGHGQLIHERINIARAATDPATLAGHYDHLVDLIGQYGRSWRQDTMAADIAGQLILIDT